MARFEYLIIDEKVDGNPDSSDELNTLGSDGWELVGIKPEAIGTNKWYFKRELNLYDACLRKKV